MRKKINGAAKVTDLTNATRSHAAYCAIAAYQETKGCNVDKDGSNEEDVTDLLADLMHYCQKNGADFDICLSMAESHYQEERTAPERLPAPMPAICYLRQKQIIPNLIPFSPATLWRKVKDGSFPAPVKISQRGVAWRVEDVQAWIKAH